MNKICFLIFIFSQTIISTAQQHKILIIDASTKEIIPYAAVKFINTNEGTFADEKGVFYVNSNIDSLEVSCLGYLTKKINTKEIQNSVYLNPTVTLLKPIQISNFNNYEILDKNKSENYIGFSAPTNSSIHIAKRFDINFTALLKTVELDIINNQTQRIALLKIFDLDQNNKPLKNIIEQHIYYKIEPFEKKIKIDLTDNQILIENKSFFIVLELFHLEVENDKSRLKIGFYKSKKTNQSLFKASKSLTNEWVSIIVPNKSFEYALNMYLTVQKTD